LSEISVLIGDRIREFRKKKGLSQEELAHRANLNTAHLGQIERGEKSPTLDSIEKIAIALDITLEELFRFKSAPNSVKETYIDKIYGYLKCLSQDEQKDVLSTIKVLMKWRNKQ